MAAGDFTNIRVESTAFDTNVLRFTYAGVGAISIYRAPHGGAFALIQTIPAAWGGTVSPYYDIALTEQTYYDYKLSDDAGLTFTSTVSVQTQKRFLREHHGSDKVALPTFPQEESVTAQNLQIMADQVQELVNGESIAAPRPCNVCPVNGSLVLDCTEGCYSFIVDEKDITDVNSISINCSSLVVNFNVPDGTTIELCGFDESTGSNGDECLQAPATGPINLPLTITERAPCPNARTILNSTPCKGDYIYECWDTGGLTRSGGRRNISVVDCACAVIANGYTSSNGTSPTYVTYSGRRTGKNLDVHRGYAGMSILFKHVNTSCAGVPASGNIVDYIIGTGAGTAEPIKNHGGQPIVGFAVNVPTTATIRDFTGYVFLYDYPNSRYIWGRYTNADLHAGDMPTTIATMAMSVITPTQVDIIIDATAGNTYSIYDVVLDTPSDTQFIAHSAITLTAEPLGYGLIWVANNAPGDHWALVDLFRETAILWWG